MAPSAIDRSDHNNNGTATQAVTASSTNLNSYDHVTWWVGNAKQAASYYVTRMGFTYLAYRGLETGSHVFAAHVISNGSAIFVFQSPIRGLESLDASTPDSDKSLLKQMHAHIEKHGDAVKDVAFEVDNVKAVYNIAVAQGAIPIQEPTIIQDKSAGKIVTAIIQTYGDTTHTLVERSSYRGIFMPGYHAMKTDDPLSHYLPPVPIEKIDHCVGNQGWGELEAICEYYERTLGFHRFWSVDDREMCSEFSAMNSVVIASSNEAIKIPINEPAVGNRMSQIEEFVKFNGGPGTQHIAFRTEDMISSVENLRKRGTQFIEVPGSYYDAMRQRLKNNNMDLEEDFAAIQKNNILIDFDEGGYLLQIFTKPVLDRPTVFIEIIQRNNFEGFGAGNFKALFQAVEREQAARGNL